MDEYSQKQYVIGIITTLKQVRKKKEEVRREFELWESRVKLARDNSRPDLAAQAADQRDRARSDYQNLKNEEESIFQELRSAKAELESLRIAETMTVDTDRLLAQLEMIVGKPDETKKAFQELELENSLDELKKSLDSSGNSGETGRQS